MEEKYVWNIFFVWFGLVWLDNISNIVGCLMANPDFIYTLHIVLFYGLSTTEGYLMQNPFYTYE